MLRRLLAARVWLVTWAGAAACAAACTTNFGDLFVGAGGAATVATGATMAMSSSSTGVPAVCGDGKLEGGEQCEDGAKLAMDGCSGECKLEGGAYDVCPTGVVLKVASKLQIADSTANHASGITLSCGMSSGPSVVYQVMPTKTGNLTMSLNVIGGNGYMAVRASCDMTAMAFACETAQPTASYAHAAQQGVPFYVAVRGKGGGKIDFTLTLGY
jgi:cysteine-rich repeat protein